MHPPVMNRSQRATWASSRTSGRALWAALVQASVLSVGCGVALGAHAMSLSEAVNASEVVDARLAAARANKDAAAQSIAISRSRLLPQVSLQGSLQELQHQSASLDELLASAPRQYRGTSSNGQLSVRQGLLRPRDRIGLEVGKSEARLGELALSTARTDLWARTVEAWVDVLFAQESVHIQARSLKSVEQAVFQERERFLRGNGTKDSLAEAEAQQAMSAAQLAEAQLVLQARLQVLERHTGQSPSSMTRLSTPSADQLGLPFSSAQEAIGAILNANAELETAREQLTVARLRAEQAGFDHFPTVDATASLTEAKSDTNDTIGTRYRSQRVGIQISIPLYTGGGLTAAQRQAQLNRESAAAEAMSVEQQIQRRVLTDWGSHAGLLQRLAASEKMVAASREVRKAAELGVSAGLRTWAEVASAEMTVSKRESERVDLLSALVKSKTRILALLPASHPLWAGWMAGLDQGTASAARTTRP